MCSHAACFASTFIKAIEVFRDKMIHRGFIREFHFFPRLKCHWQHFSPVLRFSDLCVCADPPERTQVSVNWKKKKNAPRLPSKTSLISLSSRAMSQSWDSQASQNTSRFSLAILLDGWRANVWAAEMICAEREKCYLNKAGTEEDRTAKLTKCKPTIQTQE